MKSDLFLFIVVQKVTSFNFDGTINCVNTKNQRMGVFERRGVEEEYYVFFCFVLFLLHFPPVFCSVFDLLRFVLFQGWDIYIYDEKMGAQRTSE